MTLTPAQRELVGRVSGLLTVPERLSVSDWCRKYIELPNDGREMRPGPISFADTPYLVEPLDAVGDPGVQDVVMVMPTRAGKTTLLRLAMAYFIAGDPSPMLLIDSTVDKARGLMKKELRPLITANECLRSRLPTATGGSRNDETTLEILFPGSPLTLYGANSDAQVSGDTARAILGNEVDKWRGATDAEAAIIDQTRSRTKSFGFDRKHLYSSTPTLEAGTIWREFLRTDQRRFFVRCWKCGAWQRMEFFGVGGRGGVKWDPDAKAGQRWDLVRVRETAHYECCECGASWGDEHRIDATRHGRWQPTAQGEPRMRGYQLNGFCVTIAENSFGSIASAFLRQQVSGFFSEKQDFWNQQMGMPVLVDVKEISADKMRHLECDYRRGMLPAGFAADIVIFGCDVQRGHLVWVARGFSWDGDSYLIDHGICHTWAELEQRQRNYAALAQMSYLIVDSNYEERRQEVYEQVFTRRRLNWWVADGVDYMVPELEAKNENAFLGGKLQGAGHVIPLLRVSTYHTKVDLSTRFGAAASDWHTYSLGDAPSAEDQKEQGEYYAQLTAERLQPRKRKIVGKPADEFVARGENHMLDCEVYSFALYKYFRRARSIQERRGDGAAAGARQCGVRVVGKIGGGS